MLYTYIVYTINGGILLNHKKSDILPFVTKWMDLEGIMFNEISQRKTSTLCDHLNVESKNKTNR